MVSIRNSCRILRINHLGIPKLTSGKQDDLVFGIIICFILLPIVVGGLLVFGKYALQEIRFNRRQSGARTL